MDASSIRGASIPSGASRVFALAALMSCAFLLGGTGGYFMRDVSWPASSVTTTTTTDNTTRPFVVESPPSYASPASTGQGESKRASE
jgi:hypothetical protein